MAGRLDPLAPATTANSAGPSTAPNFSKMPKKAKNSDDLWRGIIAANNDRLKAWLPPCTVPTVNASRKKCQPVRRK